MINEFLEKLEERTTSSNFILIPEENKILKYPKKCIIPKYYDEYTILNNMVDKDKYENISKTINPNQLFFYNKKHHTSSGKINLVAYTLELYIDDFLIIFNANEKQDTLDLNFNITKISKKTFFFSELDTSLMENILKINEIFKSIVFKQTKKIKYLLNKDSCKERFKLYIEKKINEKKQMS